MKQFQLVLLLALVVATIMLVKADDKDDVKCRSYARMMGVGEDTLDHCGPFSMTAYVGPQSDWCQKACKKFDNEPMDFPYKNTEACCCAAFVPGDDEVILSPITFGVNQ